MKRRNLFALLVAGAAMTFPASAAEIDLSTIGTQCLQSELSECQVLTAGFLNVADYGDNSGKPFLAWQTQFGTTDYDGLIGGFVLFQHTSDGWSLLDSGFDGYFQMPRLNDENVLHQPGYSQGTGSYNTDRVYRLGEDGTTWTPIDLNRWLDTAAPLLPGDLEIWKGVEFDFSNPWSGYVARTALWNPDDGNCCPTGGSAVITLEIDGDRLVGTAVDYSPPEKTK